MKFNWKKNQPETSAAEDTALEEVRNDSVRPKNQFALKGGAYSVVITAVVLAILIAVNVLASMLPTTLTRLDISAQNLYSVTSNTKAVVNNLQDDVTIYWIVQADQEDSVIENLLNKYDSLSDHISVVKKNPDTYPTFAEQYTDEDVANNSLVVECGDRNRYIAYDDIYLQDVDYTTYSYSYSFDGEGAITSAIGYVTTEDLPKMYILQGHGETDLPDKFSSQLTKENYETDTLSLLNEDEIPEDADCLLIYAPTSDISEEEKTILSDYVENGGKLMVFAGPTQEGDDLTNLYSILADYGVTKADGIVIDEDRDHYAFQQPYALIPDLQSSEATDPLISSNYTAIVPIAAGMQIGDTDNGTVTSLMNTSDSAFSKAAGFSMESYDKEDGDTDGPFSVGLTVDTLTGGQITWISSSYFLDDQYNEYSSGANLDLSMNALTSMIGDTSQVSIRSKSLDYNYLTISESAGTMMKIVMIGILPAAFIIIGICVLAGRRHRRHEEN